MRRIPTTAESEEVVKTNIRRQLRQRDVLCRRSQKDHDPTVLTSDQRIADGEERIARVSCLITRLEAGGFDTSAARKRLARLTESLDLMRRHRRSLACQE